MRSWLTILLILFGAVVAHAERETSPSVHVFTTGAVLSQGEQLPSHLADAPLLATTLSSASSRVNGAETMPVRSRQGAPVSMIWIRGGHQFCLFVSAPHARCELGRVVQGGLRPVDRYVYGLRKIII